MDGQISWVKASFFQEAKPDKYYFQLNLEEVLVFALDLVSWALQKLFISSSFDFIFKTEKNNPKR